MARVAVREIEYKNFGRCLEVSNNIVKVIVTIDVGPRIISYSFAGGENILFEDEELTFSERVSKEKFGDIWYTYGGHRMWTSPENSPRTYYPDNEPVAYELMENGVRLLPNAQKWNQYVFEMEVTLDAESSEVFLAHKITNLAAWPVELAPWTITAVSAGGKEVIPQPIKDTSPLNNRLIALWPYTKLTDSRVHWGDKYILLTQDEGKAEEFKFGINSQHGYAMYFNHGDLFIKQFSLVENGIYPDGGMSFETYTNNLFLEMEALGELVKLGPGESTVFYEKWSLYREALPSEEEPEFDRIAEKYIRKG